LAIQSPEGERLLAGVPEGERLRSAHAVAPDGRVWSGGDVVSPILAELGRRSAGLAVRPLGLPLRGGYRLVASNRSRLSRLMPDGARDAATKEIEEHRRRVSLAS
jgi:predicted DCC family thiol-disulfide oxidoreductase YuxK